MLLCSCRFWTAVARPSASGTETDKSTLGTLDTTCQQAQRYWTMWSAAFETASIREVLLLVLDSSLTGWMAEADRNKAEATNCTSATVSLISMIFVQARLAQHLEAQNQLNLMLNWDFCAALCLCWTRDGDAQSRSNDTRL